MKFIKIFIFIVIYFLFFSLTFAGIKIIDIDQEYNYVDEKNNIRGEYSDIIPGYFGNNFSKNLTNYELIINNNLGYYGNNYIEKNNEKYINYSNYLGFIGSNFYLDNNKNNIKNIVPVGYFGSYSGVILDFGLEQSNELRESKNNIYDENKCVLENFVKDINYEIKNNGIKDYIKLSWKTFNNISKIKVIKLFSPQKEEVFEGNVVEYIDYEIFEGDNSYFIISYNDCGDSLYSELIKIDYKINNNGPYLNLNYNKIEFLNYNKQSLKLFCYMGDEKIVDNILNNNFEYIIDEKYLNENFYCYVEFLDNSKILRSNIVYNNFFGVNISIREFLKLIYGKGLSDIEINKKFYFILQNINLESKITYEQLSFLLINIYTNLIIDEKDLAFKLLQDIGLFDKDIISKNNVSTQKVIYFLSKINSINNFRNEIISKINEEYKLDGKNVFEDFIKIYYINLELKKLQEDKKEKIISCFNYIGCEDYKNYYEFLNKINKQVSYVEYDTLGINIKLNSQITWRDYSNIIFKIIGKQKFYEGNYSLSEYNNFITILNEAIFYGENIVDEKMDYFTYKGLNLELITNTELFDSISYLTQNHLITINEIYKNIVNKEKLLLIIRDYLNK